MATRTGDWVEQSQADVNKSINAHYRYTDDLLNSMARYPTLPHADAVFLINLLDEILRNCITYVSQFTNFFMEALEDITVKYMFSRTKRDIFCGISDDILPCAMHCLCMSPDTEQWLATIKLHRLYWLLALSRLRDLVKEYQELSYIDSESPKFIEARERMAEIAVTTGIDEDVMYGVVNEINYYGNRVQKIQNKLTMPYLRKVAAFAKMRAGRGKYEACLDNYQSGVPGIFQAIGRYNTELGSYASLVEMWVNNRMLIGIRTLGNPIRVPDRAYKHKRMYDALLRASPSTTLEEAAAEIGVDEKTLAESLHFVDMQGTSQLIDESTTEDFGEGNEDYIVEDEAEDETVNSIVQEFEHVLNDSDRALIHLLFGCNVEFKNVDQSALRRESAKHLLHLHTTAIASRDA